MVLAHHAINNPDLKRLTCLPDQLSNTFSNIASQNLVAILRYPHKLVLNLLNNMTSVPVIHGNSSIQKLIVSAEAGGFNLLMDIKMKL